MTAGFPQFGHSAPQQQLPSSDPQQTQDGAPEAQGQAPRGGLQQAAPPIMVLLSNWERVAGEIGQFHPRIASMMNKVSSATKESLMILARSFSQGQQQGGLPTQDTTGVPQTAQAQPQAQPAGYQPSGY